VIPIRRPAAKQAGVPPRELSFTGAWTLVQTRLLQSSAVTLEEYTRKFRQVLRGCGQRKLPHRPQR
jgi:hypothetical protein